MFFVGACVITSIGHAIFAFGTLEKTSNDIMRWLYFGRFVSGTVYEIIDALLAITLLQPLFVRKWGLVAGGLNGFLRFGSIAAFCSFPYLHKIGGVRLAVQVASAVGIVTALLSVPILMMDQEIRSTKGSPYEENDNKLAEANSHNAVMSSSDSFLGRFPFHRFPVRFYLFALAGIFLYGAMVPFWFIGSAYLQDHYGYNVRDADLLMALPELMIIIVSTPAGYGVDKLRREDDRFIAVGSAIAAMALGFVLIVTGKSTGISPAISVAILGSAYATANASYWGCLVHVSNPMYMSLCTGFIASAVNLMPSVMPTILSAAFGEDRQSSVWSLSGMAVVGALMSFLALRFERTREAHADGDVQSSKLRTQEYELVPTSESNIAVTDL